MSWSLVGLKVSRPCAYRILGCVVVGVVLQVMVAIVYMVSPELLPGLLHLRPASLQQQQQQPLPPGFNELNIQQLYRQVNYHQESDRDVSPESVEIQQPYQPIDDEQYPRKWPIPNITGKVPEAWQSLKDKTGQCSKCPFREKYGSFCLKDDEKTYLRSVGNLTCLIEGTEWTLTTEQSTDCSCKAGWYGVACSLPFSLYNSDMSMSYKRNLTLRSKPRRLIHAFPFNMEFDFLEARIAEFGDLVDVFLILESNYTAYGEPRALQLLPRLLDGAFSDIACRIVYVFLDYFPRKAYYNGWLADHLHRDHIGVQGIGKQLRSYRHDDIFLLTDADEIPSRDTILFLKLHNGYPESFGYNYQWNIYGYFWTRGESSYFDAGMTMGMLTHVIGLRNTIAVRYLSNKLYLYNNPLNTYLRSGGVVSPWSFGDYQTFAGWHCSWCFTPKGIRTKLTSAPNSDFPRWGDYTEKLRLRYIEGLVRKGMWFDDETRFMPTNPKDPKYAPPYMLQNRNHYRYMLENIYIKD